MTNLAARLALLVLLPTLLVVWFAARVLHRMLPWHPVRTARGSASRARGRYHDLRTQLDQQRRYAHRTVGVELRDDALSAVLRGRLPHR